MVHVHAGCFGDRYQHLMVADVAALLKIRAKKACNQSRQRLRAKRSRPMYQARRIQRVRRHFDRVEVELDASSGASLADPVMRSLDPILAAELLQHVGFAIFASWRDRRVELKRAPANGDRALTEVLPGTEQVAHAKIAPGTHDIGDGVDGNWGCAHSTLLLRLTPPR